MTDPTRDDNEWDGVSSTARVFMVQWWEEIDVRCENSKASRGSSECILVFWSAALYHASFQRLMCFTLDSECADDPFTCRSVSTSSDFRSLLISQVCSLDQSTLIASHLGHECEDIDGPCVTLRSIYIVTFWVSGSFDCSERWRVPCQLPSKNRHIPFFLCFWMLTIGITSPNHLFHPRMSLSIGLKTISTEKHNQRT
jgi:hypothetical protein